MSEIKLNDYPFAWLDEVVEITLNPAVTKVDNLVPTQLETLRKVFAQEIRQVEDKLKARTFMLDCKTDIQAVAEQYYLTAQQLLARAIDNLNGYAQNRHLLKTGQDIQVMLETCCGHIRTRYRHYLPEALTAGPDAAALHGPVFKLLFRLSGDQIGILIRAAFEDKLIDATSKRAAYKALSPFLSTANKTDLSGDSLRSNAGRPEVKDLDVVVNVLQQLIGIVREYYRYR